MQKINVTQQMKKFKILYWITTAIVGVMMLFSSFMYFTNPEASEGFAHLGFPDYFRIELGIAKIAGVVLLFIPLRNRLKEWAYAGFTITFISAFIAHTASGDPFSVAVAPLIFLALLAVSYISYSKLGGAVYTSTKKV